MGFLLGIATDCERDRRGARFPVTERVLGRQPRARVRLPSLVRSHSPSPRSWRGCKSERADRPHPALQGEGDRRLAARPKAWPDGSPAFDRRAKGLASTPAACHPRPITPAPARSRGTRACSSDCTNRNDRRRFRSRTPSARSGTGSAAAENCGSSASLAGFFTPGKTQFKVGFSRDPPTQSLK